MAALTADMPPLRKADALAGVTTPTSSQTSSGGGPTGSISANNPGIDSTQSPEAETINSNTTTSTNSSQINSNNTISAAADSSDNQPSTPQPQPHPHPQPQPHLPNAGEASQNLTAAHNPYANHHIYSNSQPSTTSASNTHLTNQMYAQHIYSQSNIDLQQQQQQQQQQQSQHQPLQQPSTYPSYLNSYEQFYQQQQQQLQNSAQISNQTQNPQQMDFISSNLNPLYPISEYKQQAGLRYHPYLNAPTSGIPSANAQNSNTNNALDNSAQTAPVVSSATSSLMSPRVVSSTSPSSSSNQMQISGSASSIGSMSAGNPSSPNSANSPQCKKCGIMCTNESELQEHITNVHGASPYGSSGYASSPYIKEEMQQQTPPAQNQQTQQSATQQPTAQVGNPGDILDLDSQKMLYPPAPGSMAAMMNQPLGNTDPLHGLHSMQQRAGINSWDQQSQEGLPPYLPQQQHTTESKNLPNHSPYYQSPKQSPYHVTNSSNVIKTEYQPIIKNEFAGDTQQYINDKSFDPTAPNQQQQMMPPAVSSSPAEFPSTTTGGPQDNGQQNVIGNQQYRGGNFEPPSSSSTSITTGPVGAKAANWKSNEARRPKTYNCTACNKWFTSSGHLKRHYNTTLHKNAVKSSGQPDPASLPISVHHHPARDPNGKAGRRGAAAAAAANAANGNVQQQQQPPNPVQPPEPPNSPQDYGGSQVIAGGLAPLSHYAATPSPNSMYQQQQQQQYQQHQQHQYMPQVQSTTNASPQHASSMANHHLQQQQQQHQNQQQQTVMNGHPNALAGPSVPTTLQQTPMPSSQMRGLLNTTTPSSTIATSSHTIKTNQSEAAFMEEEQAEGAVVQQGLEVKEESMEEMEHNMYSPKDDMSLVQGVELEREEERPEQQESKLVLQQQQQQQQLGEVVLNVQHHHNTSQPPTPNQILQFQLELQQPLGTDLYPNTTSSSNMQLPSPLITSQQQYQEQQQIVVRDIYTPTQTPSPPQQLQHSIMEHQPYINMLSGINMQQLPNNMLQLQQSPIITEQQPLQPATTIPTISMVSMQPANLHHMQPLQQQHTELQQLANTQLPLVTTNTSILSHITTTSNTTNIPSYHQLQQPVSVLPPADPTLTYPHTITGNTKFLTLDSYGNLLSTSGHQPSFIQPPDMHMVQIISSNSATAKSLYTTPNHNGPHSAMKSPLEGDLPHSVHPNQYEPMTPSPTMCSPVEGNSSSSGVECGTFSNKDYTGNNLKKEHQPQPTNSGRIKTELNAAPSRATTKQRGRNIRAAGPTEPNSITLSDGSKFCTICEKHFTKTCYLTQHNKSFHSGEYPFKCERCGKHYQLEEVFLTHVEKHYATDKPHKCSNCPKDYHHKSDLDRHVGVIHKGEKKYICEICKKGFSRRDHMRKHAEIHNRVRMPGRKQSQSRAKKDNRVTPNPTNVTKNGAKEFMLELNILTEKLPENQLIASMPVASRTGAQSREINSLSSAGTPLPLKQQLNDVPAEDHFGENNLNEYVENQNFLTVPNYIQLVESDYNLGKNEEVYKEVEMDMY